MRVCVCVCVGCVCVGGVCVGVWVVCVCGCVFGFVCAGVWVWVGLCVWVFFYIIIYSACSITVSNTTCTIDILHNYLSSKNSYFFYIQVCRINCELFFSL